MTAPNLSLLVLQSACLQDRLGSRMLPPSLSWFLYLVRDCWKHWGFWNSVLKVGSHKVNWYCNITKCPCFFLCVSSCVIPFQVLVWNIVSREKNGIILKSSHLILSSVKLVIRFWCCEGPMRLMISSPCICFLQHDIGLAFLWTSCIIYFKVFNAKLCMGLQNGGKVDSVRDCLTHCKFVQVAVLSYRILNYTIQVLIIGS